MMQKRKSAHRMQCKQINMQISKTPNDKHTSARIDSLGPDQQQVKTSPAESPAVATAKINRVATNIFILKRKGMPANHKTKQRSHDQRKHTSGKKFWIRVFHLTLKLPGNISLSWSSPSYSDQGYFLASQLLQPSILNPHR